MVVIKEAGLADMPLIRELAEEVFPATYRKILTPEQIDYMMRWMYSLDSLKKQLAEGHRYYIAYVNDEAAGYVSIQQEGDDLFHLQKIYVLPRFQKARLGKKLFAHAVEEIKRIHPETCRMELNVNRYNPALGFYERLGMVKVAEGDFPIGNGYYMNDYIMGITL